MFNQNKNRYRDESAVKKWDQLKQYDEDYQDSEYKCNKILGDTASRWRFISRVNSG